MPTLEEILAFEAQKRLELATTRKGELFDPAQFNPTQLGLLPVMVDPYGRLWAVGTKPWKLITNPQESENGRERSGEPPEAQRRP